MAAESPTMTIPSTRRTAAQTRMDTLVGYLLLGGVLLSMGLILVGMAWRYAATGSVSLDYSIRGMNLYEFVSAEIRLALAGQWRPRLFVSGGIVVLMLTPYLRVLASMLYFMLALKNWKYTLFTGIVLAVLTFSLFLR